MIIDNLTTFARCANAANLELHPFLHRVPELDRPTSMVFDLDPGEGADVLACAEVALLVRGQLESSGLQSSAKVSGSKRIQVYAPLNMRVSYDQTQPFARTIAQEIVREHPDSVVSTMAKATRDNRPWAIPSLRCSA